MYAVNISQLSFHKILMFLIKYSETMHAVYISQLSFHKILEFLIKYSDKNGVRSKYQSAIVSQDTDVSYKVF